MSKEELKVGEELYLQQNGSYGYEHSVKNPYTIIAINGKEVLIQEALCLFSADDHYYDSFPKQIVANPKGKIVVLHYSEKIGGWWAYKESVSRRYPLVAYFGKYEYYPYLD